jgi:hypothetical protein
LLASPENFVSALPNGEPFICATKLPGMEEIDFDISDLLLTGVGLRPANSGQSI